MTQVPRETSVLDAVVSLVDSLLDDFDVVELLTELTERCVELLDITSAGLLLADPGRRLRLMAATSATTRDVELFQLQADEGPCLDCYAYAQTVSASDLRAAAQRWPQFVAAATEAGFASVHAVPMRAADSVLGALGLFSVRAGDLNKADLLVGQTLAHIASVAIVQEHAPRPETVLAQLSSALVRRVVVQQATGFISERMNVSLQEAFTLLRRYARTHRVHLTDVSRSLMKQRDARTPILAAMTRMQASPSS